MALRSQLLHLQFTTNSIRNNIILLDGVTAFSIGTADRTIGSSRRTSIHDLRAGSAYQRQATIKDGIFSKTIAFQAVGDAESEVVKVSSWLKEAKLKDGYPVHIMTIDDSMFIWKTHPIHRLILYPLASEPSTDNDLTAYLNLTPSSPSSSFTLIIRQGMTTRILEVLVAFLLLESKLRAEEETARRGQLVGGMAMYSAPVPQGFRI